MPLNINQLKQLEQRAKSGQLTPEDRQLLRRLIASHRELLNLLKDPDSTLEDLYACLPSDGNDRRSTDHASDRIDSHRQDLEE